MYGMNNIKFTLVNFSFQSLCKVVLESDFDIIEFLSHGLFKVSKTNAASV
jgi:hypothetical protein